MGCPAARAQLVRLRKMIADAKSAKGEMFGVSDEVLRKLPAGFEGLMSQSGKDIVTEAQGLMNKEIKSTSGQSVTGSEMPRVARAAGTGIFSSERDLENFIARYEEDLNAIEGGYVKAFGDDVAEEYQSRGKQKPDTRAVLQNIPGVEVDP